ncbi:MAG: DUF4345 domain-containing protein [Pseudomonadota bacterium]
MSLHRVALLIYAILFGGFGAYAFFNPEALVRTLGATSVSSDGLYELRGVYGGVSIGIALLCLSAVWRAALQRPALYMLLAYTGGYALARVAALPLDGVPSLRLIGFGVFEAATALIAIVLLRRSSR